MPAYKDQAAIEMDGEETSNFAAIEEDLEEELQGEGKKAVRELKEKQRELINSLNLDKYNIEDDDVEMNAKELAKAAKTGKVIALKNKNSKRKQENATEIFEEEMKGLKKAKKSLSKSKKN